MIVNNKKLGQAVAEAILALNDDLILVALVEIRNN